MSILNSIITEAWAIDRLSAAAYLPFITKLIEGGDPSALLPQQQEVSVSYMKTESFGPQNSTQEGKRIAIMNIKGVMMKDDALCSSGMESMDNRLKAILNDSSVGGVLFYVDTPGGEASYTLNFANTIASATKPTLTYTNRLMASAGYWIGSSSDEVYASSVNDQIGSIGTMVSFRDFSGALEKMGVKTLDVYADGSEEKNDRYKLLQKGDDESLAILRKEWLNPINKTFLSSVQDNRPNIQESALKGKVYYAEDAQKLGLIDGIKSFEECVTRLEEMISEKYEKEQTQKINTMTKPIQKVATFLGYQELAAKDGHISLSVEDVARIGAQLEAIPSTDSEEEDPKSEDTLSAELTQKMDAILAQTTALQASVQTLETRVETVEGKKPATKPSTTPVATETETDPSALDNVDPWNDPNDPINQQIERDLQ